MMDLVQTLTNALVVAAAGGVLAWLIHGLKADIRVDVARLDASIIELRRGFQVEIGDLRGEMGTLRSEMKSDLAQLRTELRGDIADLRTELRGDIADLRTELKGDIADLRTEMKGDIARLDASVDALRSDVTQIALAVGARRRAGND
jgi:hypothetical protein